MKGIILAGGAGTRLFPMTLGLSKQLLPIYNKPMIYYPLSVLMLAGIRDILIIIAPQQQVAFEHLLGDGSQFGIQITYAIQFHPEGLAQAFIIGEQFIGNDDVCLVLGDNLYFGAGFTSKLEEAVKKVEEGCGATVFGYQVQDPDRFGIVEFNSDKKVISIEEKPEKPKSNLAVTGLYFYDNRVVEFAKNVKPSERGELEITCINQTYLKSNELSVEFLGRGYTWIDMGTYESLMQAAQFVNSIEKYQGFKVACLEEIAYQNGWISTDQLCQSGRSMAKTEYGQYLLSLVENI
jgi:glucose-1-phosphate thymidylyltransferase